MKGWGGWMMCEGCGGGIWGKGAQENAGWRAEERGVVEMATNDMIKTSIVGKF